VVADRIGSGERAHEHLLSTGELAEVHQGLAEVGQEPQTVGVILGHQVNRAPQETGRGMHVATGEGALAGAGQPLSRAQAQRTAVVVQRPELGQIAMRLFEVVGGDLGVLGGAVAVHEVGPRREPLVQL